MNTIQKHLTPADVAAQIKLERAVHAGSFLLVEGSSDSRLLKRFIDVTQCSVTVCHGRENVLAVISILEKDGFCGILGVADADFSPLTGETIANNNVCLTDHNDVECMIIASKTWDHVLREFGSSEKIDQCEKEYGKPSRDIVYEQVAFLGSIRLCAKTHSWPLKFDDMKYHFTSNTSIEIDRDRTAAHIVARSKLTSPLEPKLVVELATSEMNKVQDYRVLCSGHDACHLLARALRRHFGSYNGFDGDKGLKDLGRVLRLSYEWEDFASSRLYHCMSCWERRNPPFRIFSDR